MMIILEKFTMTWVDEEIKEFQYLSMLANVSISLSQVSSIIGSSASRWYEFSLPRSRVIVRSYTLKPYNPNSRPQDNGTLCGSEILFKQLPWLVEQELKEGRIGFNCHPKSRPRDHYSYDYVSENIRIYTTFGQPSIKGSRSEHAVRSNHALWCINMGRRQHIASFKACNENSFGSSLRIYWFKAVL